MITCCIRYTLDLGKLEEFKKYARAWIELTEKYGGIHHGYFLPNDMAELTCSSFSFPSLGTKGADNIAIALFSFSSLEKYEAYRMAVKKDDKCKEITEFADKTQCFLSYERSFLKPL